MKRFLLAFVMLAALGGGGWLYFRETAASSRQYVTATVARGDIEDAVTAVGTLQPLEYVDVGTQVSGQLRHIHVQIGDQVKKGDLLAELDAAVYQARVEGDRANLMRLNAELREKQAQRRLAEQQFRRQEGLLRANATSLEAHQSAEAALRVAEAQIESLKAQIAQTQSTLKGNEANLGYTKIYAPMDGTVVSMTARQGQTLNANQQAPIILRIANLETMTVTTQVSEADVGKLEIGMDVYFTTLGQPNRRWYGKLRQILPTPEIVNNVVLYNALFDVDNPGQLLKTQMSAQAFFLLGSAKDVPLVPLAALRPLDGDPDRRRVRVLVGDEVQDRIVTLGVRNRVAAQVVEGLAEGEQVVLGERSGQPQNGPRVRARL